MKERDFLGVGWKFPVSLNQDGTFQLSRYEEDIKEAIVIILKTAPGERRMRVKFGCGIYDYVFSVVNISNLRLIEEEVTNALKMYEPRIELEKVEALTDENESNLINISIDYIVSATNGRQNLVYPFYLNEGG